MFGKFFSFLAAVGIVSVIVLHGPESAEAAQSTISRTCSTDSVVTVRTGVPNPAMHTHVYTATSGEKQTRKSASSSISFYSGSGYYKASVHVSTSTIESFSYVTPSCVRLG